MSEKQTQQSSYHNMEHLLTELERIQAHLDTFQQGLERSHRLATLGTIATIIAHEFNNILTPMISYCQMALQTPEDTDMVHKAISKSLSGAQNAAQICSSLLGFASNQNTADHCCVDFIVKEVLNCLAREPKKDGLTLTLEIPENCAVAVEPITLQQILLNLILNARQAMASKRGSLSVVANQLDNMVCIQVKDSGPGISEEILPHIFEPFVTHRDASESKGTGLGLAICKQLVEQNHGTIEVESKLGVGTTFSITLPAWNVAHTSAA